MRHITLLSPEFLSEALQVGRILDINIDHSKGVIRIVYETEGGREEPDWGYDAMATRIEQPPIAMLRPELNHIIENKIKDSLLK